MDVKSLRYFLAVFECKSISQAAKQCHISQPSISAAIAQLEETLATTLFIRHARGVDPTDAAVKLLPFAQQLSNDLTAVSQLFQQPPNKQPFKLGLIRTLGAKRMGQLLREFGQRVEGMELTLGEPDEPCEARIITPDDLTTNESFIPIWQDHYVLAVPVEHPLGLRTKVKVEDLNDMPFIYRTPCEALIILERAMSAAEVSFDIRARIHTLEYAVTMVQAGVGCTLVPNIHSILEQQGLRFLDIQGVEMKRTIGLALAKYNLQNNSKPFRELIQLCREVGAQDEKFLN